MEAEKLLGDFFKAIENDGRISITHIGVYAALLQCWLEHGCEHPLQVYSHEVTKLAKVSASNTYHKCVKALHDFGYIRYEPSFKRNERSKVYLKV